MQSLTYHAYYLLSHGKHSGKRSNYKVKGCRAINNKVSPQQLLLTD